MQFEPDLHLLCNAEAISMISETNYSCIFLRIRTYQLIEQTFKLFLLKQTVEASSVTEMAGMVNSCWIAEAILLRLHVVLKSMRLLFEITAIALLL